MHFTESFSPQTLLAIYRKALLSNVVDERMRSLLRSGRLAAVYYSPRGQEIVAAASIGMHLQPTDYLVTIYRGIHDQLAKGIPLRLLMAEYYAKATGACKGKGGPAKLKLNIISVSRTYSDVGCAIGGSFNPALPPNKPNAAELLPPGLL